MTTPADTRKKNFMWGIATNPDGTTPSADAHLAVLMDIRDELQLLNALLHCSTFTRFPTTLLEIRRNTSRPRAKKQKRGNRN